MDLSNSISNNRSLIRTLRIFVTIVIVLIISSLMSNSVTCQGPEQIDADGDVIMVDAPQNPPKTDYHNSELRSKSRLMGFDLNLGI